MIVGDIRMQCEGSSVCETSQPQIPSGKRVFFVLDLFLHTWFPLALWVLLHSFSLKF